MWIRKKWTFDEDDGAPSENITISDVNTTADDDLLVVCIANAGKAINADNIAWGGKTFVQQTASASGGFAEAAIYTVDAPGAVSDSMVIDWDAGGSNLRGVVSVYAIRGAAATKDDDGTVSTNPMSGSPFDGTVSLDPSANNDQSIGFYAGTMRYDTSVTVTDNSFDGTDDESHVVSPGWGYRGVGHKLYPTDAAADIGSTITYSGTSADPYLAAAYLPTNEVTYPDPTFDESSDVDPWGVGWYTADSSDEQSDGGSWPAEWEDESAIPVRGITAERDSKLLVVVVRTNVNGNDNDPRFAWDPNGGPTGNPIFSAFPVTKYVTEPAYPLTFPVGQVFVQVYEYTVALDSVGSNGVVWVQTIENDVMLVGVINLDANQHGTTLRSVKSKGWDESHGPPLTSDDQIAVTASASTGFIFAAYGWQGSFTVNADPESFMDEEATYNTSGGVMALYSGGAESIDDYQWGASLNEEPDHGFGVAVFIPPAGYTGETDPQDPPASGDTTWMRNRFRQVGSQARRGSGLMARGM